MAEESDQTDKTEEPTARRRQKAKEDGQFLRSQDTSIAVLLISVALVMYLFGSNAEEAFVGIFTQAFTFDNSIIDDSSSIVGMVSTLFIGSLISISPLLALTILLAIATAFFTGGIGFSVKAFLPKASKMNPLTGLGRMFGLKGLVELTKSFAKLFLIATSIFALLYTMYESIFYLNLLPEKVAIENGLSILIFGVLLTTFTLLVIAAIDLPYQIYSFNNKLKMTLKEVKDEYKESEGRPEVKAKIRERQRQVAMNQMMLTIADADVIVTNPDHFSVALSYEPGGNKAPIVLAKGVDFVAAAIKKKAADHTVPIFEAPLLARALFFTTDIKQEVPEPLYRAVAEVIAYIYALNELNRSGLRPSKPAVDLPASMLFDKSGRLINEG
jgi:flagellar biosynthesis protein FlhB